MMWWCAAGIELALIGMRLLGDLRQHAALFLWLFGAAFVCFLIAVRRVLARTSTTDTSRTLWWIGATAIIFRLTLLPLHPTLSDDIYRYLWDGRVQLAGVNPYTYAPDASELVPLRTPEFAAINHKGIPTVYPPLTQCVFRAAAWVAPTIHAQKMAFVGCEMLLLLCLFVALPRWGVPRVWSLLYAWNPLVIVEVAGSGHNDVLGLLWLVVGCWCWSRPSADGRDRPALKRLGVIAWGLAYLSKFVSALLVPWLLLRRQERRYLWWFVGVIVIGYLPYLPDALRWGGGIHHYAAHWEFNSFGYALLLRAIPSPAIVRTLLLMCMAGWCVWMAKHCDDVPRYLLATMGAALLLVPVVEPWYAVWLVPFLCIRPRWSWLMFSGLVALSYTALIGYVRDGTWQISLWATWLEYGGLMALLLADRQLSTKTVRRFFVSPLTYPQKPSDAFLVSVIIPALNEEEGIGNVLREIPRELVTDMIVVDNGSTDRTAEVARTLGARVVHEPRRGYGQACLSGIAALSPETDIVVFLDADHSDYPEELPKLIEPIIHNQADLVIGSRLLGGAQPRSLTPQQRVGNWLACRLIALRWGTGYTDLGPFRAIRRTTLDALHMTDLAFGWTVEMQIKALIAGARVQETPVRYRPRIGRSKISGTLTGTMRAGWTILSTIARNSRFRDPSALSR